MGETQRALRRNRPRLGYLEEKKVSVWKSFSEKTVSRQSLWTIGEEAA
uniref:Uncharacterized protein n=1 Tax=Bursaphelenchus xylophilus TaxID=6326 RepID=A0A1I7SIN6_BURXY